MSNTQMRDEQTGQGANSRKADLKLEAVMIPVTDVDRAKRFYEDMGWRLDADFAFDNGVRVVQFTPPGSGCSIQFGTNVTSAPPGSAQSLYLIVSDIEAARDEIGSYGVEISKVFHPTIPGAQFQPNATSGRVDETAPDHASYRSFATFSDPDGNGWLLQEVRTRLPGRGLSNMDVATLTELLREAEEGHGKYEPTAPKHHWSEWYSAYIVARQAGADSRRSSQTRRDSRRKFAPMRADIVPGAIFPDYELPDHRGKHRKLSELQGGDPLVLVLSRGGFCPKERRQHEGLLELHREMQVGYCRLVTISTDNLIETNEFRSGVGAQWTFLSDLGRKLQKDLDIAEYTDPHHNPMIPHTLVLEPRLRIYKIYNGYWFFGRPTVEELRLDLRAVLQRCRPDWDISSPERRAAWERNDKSDFYPYGKTQAQDIRKSLPRLSIATDGGVVPAPTEDGSRPSCPEI